MARTVRRLRRELAERSDFPRTRIPLFLPRPDWPCPVLSARRALWRYALSFVEDSARPWAEFGVGPGETLDWFAWHKPAANVLYGFDSFAGIPEPWLGQPAGQWRSARYESDRSDVVIVDGMFADSLARPDVQERLGEALGFVHVDCDLYSSTIAVLEGIRRQLVAGTVIVFDEFSGFPTWRREEGGAFLDFTKQHGMAFEYLGRTEWQVGVRVVDPGGGWAMTCCALDAARIPAGAPVTLEASVLGSLKDRVRRRH
jgi:hypothetical protein